MVSIDTQRNESLIKQVRFQNGVVDFDNSPDFSREISFRSQYIEDDKKLKQVNFY